MSQRAIHFTDDRSRLMLTLPPGINLSPIKTCRRSYKQRDDVYFSFTSKTSREALLLRTWINSWWPELFSSTSADGRVHLLLTQVITHLQQKEFLCIWWAKQHLLGLNLTMSACPSLIQRLLAAHSTHAGMQEAACWRTGWSQSWGRKDHCVLPSLSCPSEKENL